MLHGLSTLMYLPQRLTPALLDTLTSPGISVIEIFAARHHFDYTDRDAVRELATWFASSQVTPTLHMPLFSVEDEAQWSRHTAPTLNLIDTNKNARIDTMDEVKRALEAAELIAFRSCTLHLGRKDDQWDTRALDDSLTAIEHLKAFAGPLGVQLLLENLANDVATPGHLVEIVRTGHFSTVGFTLDVGHANLLAPVPETSHAPGKSGVVQAFEAFGTRLIQLDLHDNHGMSDEMLWPGSGNIDWKEVAACLATLPATTRAILESGADPADTAASISQRSQQAWDLLA